MMRISIVKTATVGLGLAMTIGLLSLAGCKGRDLEEARQQAREANAKVARLEIELSRHDNALRAKDRELNVVRHNRDELQRRVNDLIRERDQASGRAQKAQEMVTDWRTQAAGQATTAASLEQQVEELRAQVEQQQATIEEQRNTLNEQQEMIALLQAGIVGISTEIGFPFENGDSNTPVNESNEGY